MMPHRWSLRLRIFLFFALIGLGSITVIALALFAGYARVAEAGLLSAFVFSGTLAVLGILALVAGVWLLFDENLAKPIERLSARLRIGAHAGVAGAFDHEAAKYLGDLLPAAEAVTQQLVSSSDEQSGLVAAETARLKAERDRLTALLTDIPIAVIMVNAQHQIVLYDGQSAQVLSQIQTPRLNGSLFDYFDAAALQAAWDKVRKTGKELQFSAAGAGQQRQFDLRMSPLEAGSGYVLMIEAGQLSVDPEAVRPLTFDFDLLARNAASPASTTRLTELTFVVFDTETTGLLPHKDEVVQLGAVRVVRGRIVEGEEINTLVNPGIPIPAKSTKIHGITDRMVGSAPGFEQVLADFHRFARDAVMVAHNAPFDMAFLHKGSKSMAISWDHPVLDTVLASAVVFGGSETHTLDALCDRLGVTIPAPLRHTAMGDARATAEVLCQLLPLLEARGIVTFGDLIEENRKHGRLLEDVN